MDTIFHLWLILISVLLLVLKLALVVQGFKLRYAWGLAMLFLPFAATAFVVLHWDRARRTLLLWAAATAAVTMDYVVAMLLAVLYEALSGG